MLKRVARNKDLPDGVEKRKPVILASRSTKEFHHNLHLLISDMRDGERVYGSISPRNVEKSIWEFQKLMVSALQAKDTDFLFRMNRMWLRCLQRPASEDGKAFLFDLDTDDLYNLMKETITAHEGITNIRVVHEYRTKNGYHMITLPFNYTRLPSELAEVQKSNASLLWAWC